jgi:hypothetical protein
VSGEVETRNHRANQPVISRRLPEDSPHHHPPGAGRNTCGRVLWARLYISLLIFLIIKIHSFEHCVQSNRSPSLPQQRMISTHHLLRDLPSRSDPAEEEVSIQGCPTLKDSNNRLPIDPPPANVAGPSCTVMHVKQQALVWCVNQQALVWSRFAIRRAFAVCTPERYAIFPWVATVTQG